VKSNLRYFRRSGSRRGIVIDTDENQVQEIEGLALEKLKNGEEPRRRTRRRSTVIDVMTMLNSSHQTKAESKVSDILMARRRSTRASSFIEISRRYSMAGKLKEINLKIYCYIPFFDACHLEPHF